MSIYKEKMMELENNIMNNFIKFRELILKLLNTGTNLVTEDNTIVNLVYPDKDRLLELEIKLYDDITQLKYYIESYPYKEELESQQKLIIDIGNFLNKLDLRNNLYPRDNSITGSNNK